MGEWTGRRKPDLIAERPEEYAAWRAGTFTPANGETWGAFRGRVAEGVHDWMSRTEGDLLVVAHGGVVRAACHEFLDLPRRASSPSRRGRRPSCISRGAAA